MATRAGGGHRRQLGAGDQQRRGEQAGGAGQQERRAEGLADRRHQHVVGALTEAVVGGAVASGEGVALGGDRAPQPGARLVGVDALEQRGGELDLRLGRQRRVEHERDAALLGASAS